MKLSFWQFIRSYAIGLGAFHLWKFYRGDPWSEVLTSYGMSLVLGALFYGGWTAFATRRAG
ncbi:hypothetical protein QN356_06540 [Pseudomonas sp. CCC3.1]|nr:hypothetical protein [Pseudomonas sp. CCC3.1]MEB0205135.1 hypothetical protein [Pseudomonas sp. CCC3.1]